MGPFRDLKLFFVLWKAVSRSMGRESFRRTGEDRIEARNLLPVAGYRQNAWADSDVLREAVKDSSQ
ncbi:MAG: hypothetical protein JWM68_4145 [Verrucomicrobiales bacterium]|nr:hypothetical protein [Verrucomicrobiales bacterium]